MATDTKNTAPAAATQKADTPAEKAAPAKTRQTKTTARKPRTRRTAKTARKPAARRTPGATAARPTLGRPAARPAAPQAPAPEAVAAAGAPSTFGGSLLDAVEATGTRVADYHEQVAEATPLPWIAEVARANAQLTRIATRAYVSSGRTILRG